MSRLDRFIERNNEKAMVIIEQCMPPQDTLTTFSSCNWRLPTPFRWLPIASSIHVGYIIALTSTSLVLIKRRLLQMAYRSHMVIPLRDITGLDARTGFRNRLAIMTKEHTYRFVDFPSEVLLLALQQWDQERTKPPTVQ